MTISDERMEFMRAKVLDNYGSGGRYTARDLAFDLDDALTALKEQRQTIAGLTTPRGATIGSLAAWDIGRTIAFEWKGTYMRGTLDDVHGHHDSIVRYSGPQTLGLGRPRTTVNLVIGGHTVVLVDPATPCEVLA